MQVLKFECKKDGLRQTQDGGCKLTLVIHPSDVTAELLTAPMGQMFMAALAPVNGGVPEAITPPEKEKRDWADLKPSQQAGIICGQTEFSTFLTVTQNGKYQERWANEYAATQDEASSAAYCLRLICQVASRKELDTNKEAKSAFNQVVKEYLAWKEFNL